METENEDEQVQKQCVQLFSSTDFIMESKVFDTIKDYFRHGGAPDQVIELLSENYMAIAQTATLMADWLILTGVEPADVVNMIVQHLQTLIEKHFQPKKADSIFEAGGVPSWLTDMTEHMNWRSMIYKLAEEYPNCLMLNFTIKLLVDSGHEDEITSVPVAAQQVEVFTKVLMTTIQRTIDSEPDEWKRNIQELVQLACHSEHTYLYAQSVLSSLANDAKSMIIRRIAEEIELHAKAKGHNVTEITLTLDGTTAFPKVYQPLCTMLSKKALNPADVTSLYKIYQSADAPPVDLIRKPAFIELLITQLFDPDSTLNPEHRPKYIGLLAYACSVAETNKKSSRKSTTNSKEELSQTTIALEKAHEICVSSKSTVDLISDLNELYKCLRFPIVAACVLRWIEFRIFDPSYFKLDQGTTPVHLIIIDEIVSLHFLLHQKAFELLVRFFEATFAELDILVHLEFKKTILDRMVHMLSCSFVHPILEYMKKRWEQRDTDVSLIRHFVLEVLEMIGPPYEPSFVQLFLPLLQNEAIAGPISLRNEEERKCVKEFIDHASTIVSSHT
ncbi:unnamed protein product [Adineta steineri]|uniref:Negative elongation factor D n=2 Tax=Adineta steineri TaxID=433720 RepID=A0A815MHH8_9BILA|nr:unnamed protein product [Adineta steineri]CAF1239440.1 unnamed protein product [Adineta steineri]CAF1273646.1 unnamed protein product [Adineta steineri]CAF1420703.1 unnamed protein product [Adineta steineri]CAF1426282.1 unnamed protein product [Adineta steineri]